MNSSAKSSEKSAKSSKSKSKSDKEISNKEAISQKIESSDSTANSTTSENAPKRKKNKILIYLLIILIILFLCCITSVGFVATFSQDKVQNYLNELGIETTDDTSDDNQDETGWIEDTEVNKNDNQGNNDNVSGQDGDANSPDSHNDSNNNQGDSNTNTGENTESSTNGASGSDVTWSEQSFNLEVPLSDDQYRFQMEVPSNADWYVGKDNVSSLSYGAAYFSFTLFTVPEAYGIKMIETKYLFDLEEFGSVYRVRVQAEYDDDYYYYSNHVTTEGTCNIMGESVNAPCGVDILEHKPTGGFFVASCDVNNVEHLDYCDQMIKSINFSVE
jgi:hypothetical protein